MGLGSFYEDILDRQGDRGPIFIRKPGPCLHRQKKSVETSVPSDEIRQKKSVETSVPSDEIRPLLELYAYNSRSGYDKDQRSSSKDKKVSDKNRKESDKKENAFIRFFRSFFNFRDNPWKSEILGYVIAILILLVLSRLDKDE